MGLRGTKTVPHHTILFPQCKETILLCAPVRKRKSTLAGENSRFAFQFERALQWCNPFSDICTTAHP
jgi:hypothetical protein